MKKIILSVFVLLCAFSCKRKVAKKTFRKLSHQQKTSSKIDSSCKKLFMSVLCNSNYDTKGVKWDKISILIDEISDSTISAKLKFQETGFLNGYVKLNLSNLKLSFISPYTGEEQFLKYNQNLLNNISSDCFKINKTETNYRITNFDFPITSETIKKFNGYSNLSEKEFERVKNIIISYKPSDSELSSMFKIYSNNLFDTYVYFVEEDSVFSVLININNYNYDVIDSKELHYETHNDSEFFIINKNLITSVYENKNISDETIIEKIKVNKQGKILQIFNNRKKLDPSKFKAPN